MLWEIIGDKPSEIYLKRQQIIKKYKFASRIFVMRLCLLVRGLKQDQLGVIFHITCLPFYNTLDKVERFAMSEIFDVAQLWVNN